MATSKDVINILKSWIGKKESDGSFKTILDIYNSHKPLARSYKVKTTDEWCAATVSAAFIKAKAVDAIGGTECSVQRFIDIFKKKGIWIEDGRVKPKAGDIICYNWDDSVQPNDGWADHIGLVESVSSSKIIVIEGNGPGGAVFRRTIPIGWGYIRGYARPKYTEVKPASKPKFWYQAFFNGKWGKNISSGAVGRSTFCIRAFRINATNKDGSPYVKTRVKYLNGGWSDYKLDRGIGSDGKDFSGDKNQMIEYIQMELKNCPGWEIEYRAKLKNGKVLPWVRGANNYSTDGYAGLKGYAIRRIWVRAVRV